MDVEDTMVTDLDAGLMDTGVAGGDYAYNYYQ